MKNNILKFGLIAFFGLLYTLPIMAQENDPGIGGGFGDEDPEPGAPIDNWMFILVIAAAAIGVYFLWKKQNKKAIA